MRKRKEKSEWIIHRETEVVGIFEDIVHNRKIKIVHKIIDQSNTIDGELLVDTYYMRVDTELIGRTHNEDEAKWFCRWFIQWEERGKWKLETKVKEALWIYED